MGSCPGQYTNAAIVTSCGGYLGPVFSKYPIYFNQTLAVGYVGDYTFAAMYTMTETTQAKFESGEGIFGETDIDGSPLFFFNKDYVTIWRSSCDVVKLFCALGKNATPDREFGVYLGFARSSIKNLSYIQSGDVHDVVISGGTGSSSVLLQFGASFGSVTLSLEWDVDDSSSSSKSSSSKSSKSSISSPSSPTTESSVSFSTPSSISSISSLSTFSESSLSSTSISSSSGGNIDKKQTNIRGHLINKNIDHELIVNTISNPANIDFYLFSKKFLYSDIEFLYRLDYGDTWNTDAIITDSSGAFISGNKIFKLPCSSSGQKNTVKWDYSKNNLTSGSNVQIKIKTLPSLDIFSHYNQHTILEHVATNYYNEIQAIVERNIIGLDNYGNYMCSGDNVFLVVDKNNNLKRTYTGFKTPICAQQIYNDNYLVLDVDDNKIVEISPDGTIQFQIQSPVLFNAPPYFSYDVFSNNLLISGGNKHLVYEISWNLNDKGTILWQHGGYGTGINDLKYPLSVIYDDQNKNTVYISDSGNQRIKKINRDGISDEIEIITTFSTQGIDVNYNVANQMFSTKEGLVVVENEMEREFFNTDIKKHPSLARAITYNRTGITSKDNLPEYSNLLFAPILGVEE